MSLSLTQLHPVFGAQASGTRASSESLVRRKGAGQNNRVCKLNDSDAIFQVNTSSTVVSLISSITT